MCYLYDDHIFKHYIMLTILELYYNVQKYISKRYKTLKHYSQNALPHLLIN